ncbi:MAG TPA: rcc01693 family protein [Devosia sp.]|jgi:uncharacterized phage protein (TIGR02216 family)|uniref:rcc01693 family protein n=1 Tax=Devosia sp. TaxID=1871048 RepID=UPI002F93803D
MTPFPWEAAMRFGLGVLRLAPDAFWRMTPRELSAAWSALPGTSGALPRDVMKQLMERFPDER